MTAPLLEISNIEKGFHGVKVLRGISFAAQRADAVGLVGENGAGKSTLMNILSGNIAPDSGRMVFAGETYSPSSPREAEQRGIAFVHQELNLFPNLSIAENLLLTRLPKKKNLPLINRKELRELAAGLLSQVGLKVDPDTLVAGLSTGERQLVEIAKCLAIDASLIIFDEPTTSLSVREKEWLIELIGRLRSKGIALIYISHALNDVFKLCERIVVLRDGAVVGQGAAASFTNENLVSLMVGRQISNVFPPKVEVQFGQPRLQIKDLSITSSAPKVSLTVRSGEIVGIGGLMGAGRSELARSIFGVDPRSGGEALLDGKAIKPKNPRDAIAKGIGFLTESRSVEGLCLDASVAENILLPSLRRYRRAPLGRLPSADLKVFAKKICDLVKIDQKASLRQPVRTLSGGNQQKVVLGKWLLNEPKALILDEPTRGIDVGAKYEIYQIIGQLARNGAAILVISSEIEELIGICDRILIMRRGQIVAEFERGCFDREAILRSAFGEPSKL